MKLAVIADVHIGCGRSWFSDLQSEAPFYLTRHKKCLQEILDKLQNQENLEILLLGDLLHFSKPTAAETRLLGWWLESLSKIAPVHIISGNHEDLYGSLTVLHSFPDFTTSNTNLRWHLDFTQTEESFGKVLWVSHNQTSKLKEWLGSNKTDYLVGHYAAKGCVYDSGMTAPKGWEFDYLPGKIRRWFVGDIHLRQKLAPNASYPGSPLQINFGESGSKGFDLYDTETGDLTQIILTKATPLMTEVIRTELPEFNPNVLYRVFVSNEFLNFDFPPNVVDVQPIGSKKVDDELNVQVLQNSIDFGDPLAGLEDTLKRTKLPESLYKEAQDTALEIMR